MKTDKCTPALLFIVFVCLPVTMFVTTELTPVARSAIVARPTAPDDDAIATAIDMLVGQADLIARAQVVQSKSRWNSSRTLLETTHKLAVHSTLVGKKTTELLVYTDGGFLPEEGVGMRSSHTATFSVGEEVLVFLQKK